jgi:pilus assembly protein CpaB
MTIDQQHLKTIYYFIASVILGIAAVFIAATWVNKGSNETMTMVAVAGVDIPAGSRVDGALIKIVGWPTSIAVKGAVEDPTPLFGRITRTNIYAGEPITEQKLRPEGSRAGLSALIPDGQRAITIRVNDVIGVAGFALPGNYVDILVNLQDQKGQSVSKIVLEKILVLAVAQDSAVADESKPRVANAVTLEVSPEQAEKLDLARSAGTLSLMLRNQTDIQTASTRGAKISDVLSGPVNTKATPGTVRPIIRERAAVEVIRGAQRSFVEL